MIKGKVDLRVPRLLCVVHKAVYHPGDIWMVYLVDSTGCMNGYISSNCLKMHEGFLQSGTALVLENCSLFVHKVPLERHLNIIEESVLAVYTNKRIDQ